MQKYFQRKQSTNGFNDKSMIHLFWRPRRTKVAAKGYSESSKHLHAAMLQVCDILGGPIAGKWQCGTML